MTTSFSTHCSNTNRLHDLADCIWLTEQPQECLSTSCQSGTVHWAEKENMVPHSTCQEYFSCRDFWVKWTLTTNPSMPEYQRSLPPSYWSERINTSIFHLLQTQFMNSPVMLLDIAMCCALIKLSEPYYKPFSVGLSIVALPACVLGSKFLSHFSP